MAGLLASARAQRGPGGGDGLLIRPDEDAPRAAVARAAHLDHAAGQERAPLGARDRHLATPAVAAAGVDRSCMDDALPHEEHLARRRTRLPGGNVDGSIIRDAPAYLSPRAERAARRRPGHGAVTADSRTTPPRLTSERASMMPRVDDARQDVAGGLGGQLHPAPVGVDPSLVRHSRAGGAVVGRRGLPDQRPVDGEADESVAEKSTVSWRPEASSTVPR